MKRQYGEQLRAIRNAEGLTPSAMAEQTGINLITLKKYEAGHEIELSMIERILFHEQFRKYTLWLMIGKTSETAGQIAPALSHSGREKIDLLQLTGRAG